MLAIGPSLSTTLTLSTHAHALSTPIASVCSLLTVRRQEERHAIRVFCSLFDHCNCSVSIRPPPPQQVDAASKILNELKDDPRSWTVVDRMIANAQSVDMKFFAASILHDLARVKWNALPDDQRSQVRDFVTANIVEISSAGEEVLRANRVFVGKLNLVLVEILKKEWTTTWSTFIPEIVQSSKASESICQNNMEILLLLRCCLRLLAPAPCLRLVDDF